MPSALLERLRTCLRRARAAPRSAASRGVWIVGGAVRDLLLGGEPGDLDLVVEGDALASRAAPPAARRRAARPRALRDRDGARPGGHAYDLAGARARELRRARRAAGRAAGATLEEDLRGATSRVNAIALAAATGACAAVPHAREDLDARLLRVLHDAIFRDDPTRLLRLARYATRLGFEVEPHTAALAAAAVADGALGR